MYLGRQILQINAPINYRDYILKIISIFILFYYLFFPEFASCGITYYAPDGTMVTKEEFERISKDNSNKASTKQSMANNLKSIDDKTTKSNPQKITNYTSKGNSIDNSLQRMSKRYGGEARIQAEAEQKANEQRTQSELRQEQQINRAQEEAQNQQYRQQAQQKTQQSEIQDLRNREADKLEAAASRLRLSGGRKAELLTNAARIRLGQEPVPHTPEPFMDTQPKGAINIQTGEHYPPAAGGIIEPKTGTFLPDVGAGYVNPRTGEFIPKTGP